MPLSIFKKPIAAWAIGFLLLIPLAYFFLDPSIAIWIDQEAARSLVHFFFYFTQISDTVFGGRWIYKQAFWSGHSPLALLIFRYLPLCLSFALARFLQQKKLARAFGEGIFLHFFSSLLIVFLKTSIQRNRPFEFLHGASWEMSWGQGGGDSFPSGHTGDYWALFLPFMYHFPAYRIYLALIPLLISLGRIALGMHFLSDVLGAIYLVGLLYALIRQIFTK